MSETAGFYVMVGILVISGFVSYILARRAHPVVPEKCWCGGGDRNHEERELAWFYYGLALTFAGWAIFSLLSIIHDPQLLVEEILYG